MWLGIIVLTATSGHALQGRPAVVQFHEALLAGLDARDALARLESMENATPDVVTYSLVAGTLLDAGLDDDADGEKPALVKDMFASERRKAKVLNFSIAYGKTAHGLAKDFGVSTKEAEETVDLWYSDRPEVREWQAVQHKKAAEKGKVNTLLGRHRNLPEASSSDEMRRGHALRASINTPIQGGAADIAMLAMIQIHRCPRLRELGFKLLMQIHDEVILEGPEEHRDEALALVKLHMEKPFNDHENLCDVELSVDGDYAKTWFEAK